MHQGAGEANIGIATLLAMAMEKREGVPFEQVASWIIIIVVMIQFIIIIIVIIIIIITTFIITFIFNSILSLRA